jgi:CRP-like cAMP-binding protein/GNAT superfamily N-acetyltransferase
VLTVIEAVTRDERESAFRLRYDVYVREMGRSQPHADHARQAVEEPFDSQGGHIFLARDGDVPVGTVRVNLLREGPLECQDLYELERFVRYYPNAISMTTKLMVTRSHRGAAASWQLAAAAYRFARDNGVLIDFIDTNPHLVRMYQRFGYRFYKSNISHPEYGSVVPMAFFVGDVSYLEVVGSPFLELARGYPNDAEASRFFATTFSDYASILPTWAMSEEELWKRYAESAGFDAARAHGFLCDLEPPEVKELLGHFDPVRYAPGDAVMKQGDYSQGMYCLLEGQAEVRSSQDGSERIVDLLHPGDVFGEMGFIAKLPRTASIVIREPSRVLVLSEPEFRRFASRRPEIALKVLTRLFTIVVERFHYRIGSRSSA